MKLLQPDSEISLWEKVTEFSTAQAELIIRLDGRRLVSRRDLRRIWDCSDVTLKKYASLGMPKVDLDLVLYEGFARAKKLNPNFEAITPNLSVYDLSIVNAWRDQNIDDNNGRAAEKKRKALSAPSSETLPEDLENDNPQKPTDDKNYALREMIAKTTSAEEDAKTKTLKRQLLEGRLIPADELDKAMAEQAMLHKSDKLHDENALPAMLENKSASEIKELIYQHNLKRLSRLDELINKELDSKVALYDVIEATLVKLTEGVSLDEILGAINAKV